MSKKHLTYDDRLAIQAGLQKGLKVAQIARNIGKDRATIGREIKAHRRLVTTSGGNNCINHKTCTRIPDCRSGCHRGKRQCQTACGGCQKSCPEYREEFCSDYERSPFVCNPCDHRLRCRLRRMLYDAKYAQEQYEKTLSESRRGISLTEQELNRINDTVSPLLKKGQSLPTICDVNGTGMNCRSRTAPSTPILMQACWMPETSTCAVSSGGRRGRKAARFSGWIENAIWGGRMKITRPIWLKIRTPW